MTAAPEPWSGLVLAISKDRAVLGPEGAALVCRLVAVAEATARRDGAGLSPQLTHLRDVLAPMAGERHGDVRNRPVPQPWTHHDEIPTTEAAQMLNRSPRQVQRLAESGAFGPARRVGRGYLIPRAEVTAYLARCPDRGTR